MKKEYLNDDTLLKEQDNLIIINQKGLGKVGFDSILINKKELEKFIKLLEEFKD